MTDINIRSFAQLGAELMRYMEATQIGLRLKTILAEFLLLSSILYHQVKGNMTEC